jgi:hypothetical protein
VSAVIETLLLEARGIALAVGPTLPKAKVTSRAVSSGRSDVSVEEGREAVASMRSDGLPPIVDHNTCSRGTDVAGRDEGEAWQLWLRRHDEYETE